MKLDISQPIVESCALDEEGNKHREGGAEHGRVKEVGVTNRTWPIQDGERERKSECWAMIKRV